MDKPKAEWTGVIVFKAGEVEIPLDCRLYSAYGRAPTLPIVMIHATPTCGASVKENEQKETDSSAAEIRTQPYCPKCQRNLTTDEIGRAVQTENATIRLTNEEIASLKFEPTKKVVAEAMISETVLETVGVGRRFYAVPKPGATDNFCRIRDLLRMMPKVIGFIECIVLDGKPRVAVLRMLYLPKLVVGKQIPALVVELVNDSGRLKNPLDLPDYPDEVKAPDTSDPVIANALRKLDALTKTLNPEMCLDPHRKRAAEVAEAAVKRSLNPKRGAK